MQESMYTVKEVADKLKVSERQVRKWVETGELARFRIGLRGYRIPESSLNEFVRRRTGRENQE
ncbi:MAG: helix-turn-helix domain-containing protein [Ktedonobacteraceae bacterium]